MTNTMISGPLTPAAVAVSIPASEPDRARPSATSTCACCRSWHAKASCSRVRDERRYHRRTKPDQPVLVLASYSEKFSNRFTGSAVEALDIANRDLGEPRSARVVTSSRRHPTGTLCLLDVGIREPHNP